MKKCLVVLTMGILALVLCTATASANTLSGYFACGGVGGPSGSTAFSSSSSVTGSATVSGSVATITCAAISGVPVGDYLVQVDLYLKDDAQAPAALNASVIDAWASASTGTVFTQQITTGSSDGINFNECSATGGMQTSGVCPIIESFLESSLTSFGAVVATVSATAGANGGVSGVGSDSANLYIQYEYAPTTPEPATLSLMGGALLGLGLFGRKLSRR